MNSDIKELKIDSGRWIKNGVISLITVVLVLLLFKGKSLLIPTTLVITGIFISIICFISLLFYTLKYRHDKYIKIEIENNSIIRYYEKNQCLYTFEISDIQSITYYQFLKSYPVASLDLKNKMNIYLSDLIDIQILFSLNDQILQEEFVSNFLEELWNPIYSVQNQLKLLLKEQNKE
jgi:hypothetical protein